MPFRVLLRRVGKTFFGFLLVIFFIPNSALAWTAPLTNKNDIFRDPIVSDDGKTIAVLKKVHNDPHQHVVVYSKDSATPIWEYKPDEMVFGLAMSADGKTIAAVGGKIWVLNRETKKVLWKNQVETSVFDAVAVSDNGSVIVAGDREGTVFFFGRTSSTPIKTLNIAPSEDGIFSLDTSSDGKTVIAGTKKSINFVKQSKGLVWKYNIGLAKAYNARLSSDGKRALATTKEKAYFFNTAKSSPAWTKDIKSSIALSIDLADTGKRMAITSKNKVYYILEDGTVSWTYDMHYGTYGDVQMSSDGQYVYVAQGKDTVFLFDGHYKKGEGTGRPFRIVQAKRPRYIGGNASGARVSYGPEGLETTTVEPGILVEQDSIPVYYKNAPMDLKAWITNPGAAQDNLNVRVALSLPQFNWWNAFSQQTRVRNEDPAARSKLMDAANYAMPGYREVYDSHIFVAEHDGSSLDLSFLEVPDLLEPQWVEDMRKLFEEITPYLEFLSEVVEPLEDLLDSEEYKEISGEVEQERQRDSSFFPLLGLGTAELYDPETNVIVDQDSFYFIYLSETDGS